MSLVLMFIYWVAIPVFALYAGRVLLRHARTPFARGLLKFIGTALFLGWFWLILGKQLWLDHQVRELCAKDGGIRVYETVTLPAEKFNQWGQPNFYKPNQGENALGSDYVFKRETFYYNQGNPDLFRLSTQVFRRADGKLLGASVFYKRGGGGLPGPWHGTSFICPELGIKTDVLRHIFVINNKE